MGEINSFVWQLIERFLHTTHAVVSLSSCACRFDESSRGVSMLKWIKETEQLIDDGLQDKVAGDVDVGQAGAPLKHQLLPRLLTIICNHVVLTLTPPHYPY